jgi:hypothetical protein
MAAASMVVEAGEAGQMAGQAAREEGGGTKAVFSLALVPRGRKRLS